MLFLCWKSSILGRFDLTNLFFYTWNVILAPYKVRNFYFVFELCPFLPIIIFFLSIFEDFWLSLAHGWHLPRTNCYWIDCSTVFCLAQFFHFSTNFFILGTFCYLLSSMCHLHCMNVAFHYKNELLYRICGLFFIFFGEPLKIWSVFWSKMCYNSCCHPCAICWILNHPKTAYIPCLVFDFYIFGEIEKFWTVRILSTIFYDFLCHPCASHSQKYLFRFRVVMLYATFQRILFIILGWCGKSHCFFTLEMSSLRHSQSFLSASFKPNQVSQAIPKFLRIYVRNFLLKTVDFSKIRLGENAHFRWFLPFFACVIYCRPCAICTVTATFSFWKWTFIYGFFWTIFIFFGGHAPWMAVLCKFSF